MMTGSCNFLSYIIRHIILKGIYGFLFLCLTAVYSTPVTKSEQYSRRNNVELSNIPNDIPDNQLENKVIQICCESGIEVDHNDIDGCPRLPVSRYSRGDKKRVIIKFINRKHTEAEALLFKKKSLSMLISKETFLISISQVRYLCLYLCVLPFDLFGVSVKICREEVKTFLHLFLYFLYFLHFLYNCEEKHVSFLAQTIFNLFTP